MSYLKAIAIDYDGTLTSTGSPSGDVLTALREARAAGLRTILVSGRIVDELRGAFPDVERHFDAIVAENGAILLMRGSERLLADPPSPALYDLLRMRGVAVRRGRVLLACRSTDDAAVVDGVRELGLEDQLIHNRGELMVLPPGVTKASGVRAALGALGLSPHNTAAIGDAENDHALLAECQLAVAVENAVASLKAEADVVLDEPDGEGVSRFLRSATLRQASSAPTRHHVPIGVTTEGRTVTIDPTQRLLITGGTHSGKSYLAGLYMERLVAEGYATLVVDAEGDHSGLADIDSVALLTAEQAAVSAQSVAALPGRSNLSCVIDLTGTSIVAQQELVTALMPHVLVRRREVGMPHVITLDEAHLFATEDTARSIAVDGGDGGWCLVTYVPSLLDPEVLGSVDVALVLPFGDLATDDSNLVTVADAMGASPDVLGERFRAGARALLLNRRERGLVVEVVPDERTSMHVRHRHKYAEQMVAPERAFRFCSHDGDVSGAVVRSLDELHRELRRCSPVTLLHHAARHDWSRWIVDVLRDEAMARDVADAEGTIDRIGAPSSAIESGRAAILDAIARRYFV